jgi:tRNA threonylcarbamoyladenosine modification (KEOPS) complex  Pcc1 subunit
MAESDKIDYRAAHREAIRHNAQLVIEREALQREIAKLRSERDTTLRWIAAALRALVAAREALRQQLRDACVVRPGDFEESP